MQANELAERLTRRLSNVGSVPVAHGIIEELWLAVVDGSLESGERLPTTRQLAIALGVSPRTIAYAYTELERRGVVVSRPGAGSFISLAPASESDRARHQQLAALCLDTVEQAAALGFDIDQLLDALAEFRTVDQHEPPPEPPS